MQRTVSLLILLSIVTLTYATTDSYSVSPTVASMLNFKSVSAGGRHTCAIRNGGTLPSNDGTMLCFGYNNKKQLEIPKGVGGWEQVSAGWMHTCAIDTSHKLHCWGDDIYKQASPPSDLLTKNVKAVSSGKTHSCALDWGGQVTCWGDSQLDKTATPTAAVTGPFVSLCTGTAHSCAVNSTGTIFCWGYNGLARATVPRQVISRKFTSVSCKGAHTCAMDSKSRISCWGHDGHGQATVPTLSKAVLYDSSITPTSPDVFKTVSAGLYTTCAVRGFSEAESADCNEKTSKAPPVNTVCWGDSSYGQASVPYRPDSWKKREVCNVIRWEQIDVGGYHTCAITQNDKDGNNMLGCWGMEDDGQLTLGSFAARISPPFLIVSLILACLAGEIVNLMFATADH